MRLPDLLTVLQQVVKILHNPLLFLCISDWYWRWKLAGGEALPAGLYAFPTGNADAEFLILSIITLMEVNL